LLVMVQALVQPLVLERELEPAVHPPLHSVPPLELLPVQLPPPW
jgi:hypothetical protein